MELICPNCNRTISPDNINIATDLAKCDNCKAIHKASSLVSATKDEAATVPPKGSGIELTEGLGGSVRIKLPHRGISGTEIFLIVFSVFWLSFIATWTWAAIGASIFFALFSIPFWIVGFMMLGGIINSIRETQTVTLNERRLTIDISKPFGGKAYDFDLDDIHAIRLVPLKFNPFSWFSSLRYFGRSSFVFGPAILSPAVLSGIGTRYFFEWANDAEQEWITKFLESKRQQMR